MNQLGKPDESNFRCSGWW